MPYSGPLRTRRVPRVQQMDSLMSDGIDLPSTHHARGMAAGLWQDDPAQRAALGAFDRIHRALLAPPPGRLARLRARLGRSLPGLRGLYLWGPVGRGKTMLMDQFVASLPAGIALR